MVETRHTEQRLSEELANTRAQLQDRLALLPARKRKIYYNVDSEQGRRRSYKKKSKLWEMVWNTSKPVIAAHLAKELAEKVKTPSTGMP